MPKKFIPTLRGFVLPLDDETLRDVWKAFEVGSTWTRRVKRSSKRQRYRHGKDPGELRLEWWGPVLRFEITGDSSGKVSGAFVGQVLRHGGETVDRIELRFEE